MKKILLCMVLLPLLVGCAAVESTEIGIPTETKTPEPPPLTQTPSRTSTPTLTLPPTLTFTPTQGIGSTWLRTKDGMVMVYVPAGEFVMGDDNGSTKGDEEPAHTVYLDAYWIDQTEVTNAMFAVFLNEMGNQNEGGSSWLHTRGQFVHIGQIEGSWKPWVAYPDQAVSNVTWYGARAYCTWADDSRLPTEAEWEKAARGTDERDYPWGNGYATFGLACYHMCCRSLHFGSCVSDSTEVGLYPEGASPFGAYDMAGNVWEWVKDWYDRTYYTQSPYSNPTGPASGSERVMRGGSWLDEAYTIRSAYRNSYPLPYAWYDIGFRCVRSP